MAKNESRWIRLMNDDFQDPNKNKYCEIALLIFIIPNNKKIDSKI